MIEDLKLEYQRFLREEFCMLVREVKELKELVNALILGQADLVREMRENSVKINGMPDEGARQQAFHALYRASERRSMQFDEAILRAQKNIKDIETRQTQLLEMLEKICEKVDSFDKIREAMLGGVNTLQHNLTIHGNALGSHSRFMAELEERQERRRDTILNVAVVFAIIFLVVEFLIRRFA